MRAWLICACLCALACAAASAAPAFADDAWPEGLSPAKPFPYVEEADLAAHVGYVMTLPENETRVPCGTDSLIIYTPRTDFVELAGSVTVTLPDGGVYAVSTGEQAQSAPMTAAELDYYGWGGGTLIRLPLDRPLEPHIHCAVNIPAGALVFEGLHTPSASLDGNVMWAFDVAGFGIAERTDDWSGAEPRHGDTTTLKIRLGDSAASARLTVNSPMTMYCDLDDIILNQETDLLLQFDAAGHYSYTLEFFDERGRSLGGMVNSGRIID